MMWVNYFVFFLGGIVVGAAVILMLPRLRRFKVAFCHAVLGALVTECENRGYFDKHKGKLIRQLLNHYIDVMDL